MVISRLWRQTFHQTNNRYADIADLKNPSVPAWASDSIKSGHQNVLCRHGLLACDREEQAASPEDCPPVALSAACVHHTMAANYWVSTQRRHWMFTRERLAEIRESLWARDKDSHQVQLPDMRIINIYFKDQICRLAKRMNSRQQAVATAQVYMKRFYTKVDFRQTNPYLVMVTAFYLACKMEECPQHIRFIAAEARQFWPEFVANDPAKIGECEFYLISEMSSQLIVHHPYRTVSELSTELELSVDEANQASNLISDHYQTDLPLLYPPHIIGVMAVLLAVLFSSSQRGSHMSMAPSIAASLREGGMGAAMSALGADRQGTGRPDPRVQKVVNWLAESEIDIRAVIECTQEMVSLYELMEGFNLQQVKEVITRMMKTKSMDK